MFWRFAGVGWGSNVACEGSPSSLRFPASEKSGVDLMPVSTPERLGVGTPGMVKPEVEMIDLMMSLPLGGDEDAEEGAGEGAAATAATADGTVSLAALCVGCLMRETTPPDLSPGRAICSRPPARLASEVVGVVCTIPPLLKILDTPSGRVASPPTLTLFGGDGGGRGGWVAAAVAAVEEDDLACRCCC